MPVGGERKFKDLQKIKFDKELKLYVRNISVTLKSITEPKNMFITDMRKRRERPDIRVPEEEEEEEEKLVTCKDEVCVAKGGETLLNAVKSLVVASL